MPFIPDQTVGCDSTEHLPPFGLRGPGTWVCPDCGKRTRVPGNWKLDYPAPKYPHPRGDWEIRFVMGN